MDWVDETTVEVVPVTPRYSRAWPVIGGALVWAARELLPEVLSAWRTSRGGILRSAGRDTVAFGRIASQQLRAGQRHRWGRV